MAILLPKGGRVVKKAWVPLGTKDDSSVIAASALMSTRCGGPGGSDAGQLPNQPTAVVDKPFIGGSITVDQNCADYRGRSAIAVGTASLVRWRTASHSGLEEDRRRHNSASRNAPSLAFSYLYSSTPRRCCSGFEAVKGRPVATTVQALSSPCQARVRRVPPDTSSLTRTGGNAIGDNLHHRVAKRPIAALQQGGPGVLTRVQTRTAEAEFTQMALGSATLPTVREPMGFGTALQPAAKPLAAADALVLGVSAAAFARSGRSRHLVSRSRRRRRAVLGA